MALQGKGFFIWKIPDCEGGNPAEIASVAQAAGLTHVLIKIADEIYPVNIDRYTNTDLIPPVVQSLKAKNIQVWGWHYVYGDNPVGEANIAVSRTLSLGLDGYVIDAESEFKQSGKEAAARTFVNELRNGLPNLPIALSSFRYPSYHPQFPWSVFLEKVDLNMPQVYWEQAHNSGDQLRRCVQEFQAKTLVRPVFPTGPVYKANGWRASPIEIVEFLDTAKALNLAGANFFAWDYRKTILSELWDAVAAYSWPVTPPGKDITELYIDAVNSHDPNKASALYASEAIHITAARTVQGTAAIQTWYSTLFNQLMPNASFNLVNFGGTGNIRQFHWEAHSNDWVIQDGSDTIGLLDGKIAYHYSFYTIAPS